MEEFKKIKESVIAFSDKGEAISFFESVAETLKATFYRGKEYTHCSFRKPDGETIQVFWNGDPGEEIHFSGRYSETDYQQDVRRILSGLSRRIEQLIYELSKK